MLIAGGFSSKVKLSVQWLVERIHEQKSFDLSSGLAEKHMDVEMEKVTDLYCSIW